MNESWNIWRQFGLSWTSVSGVNEIVVAGWVTITSVLWLLQVGARREIGHLADRGAGAELGHLLAVAEDLDLALRDDVEAVAFLALAVERVAEGEALPLGAVHDFPQLDIAEAARRTRASAAG